MAKYKYIRVSTSGQNIDRQVEENVELVSDKCSGTIPFSEREGGNKLLDILVSGDELIVQSVDRLGRDKMDMLMVLDELRSRGVDVFVQNLGLHSFVEGKYNSVFDIITTLLSSLSEYEKEQINERTRQGIEVAKAQGKYRGRKKGTTISRDRFLESNKDLVRAVKKHPKLSLRELSALTGVSHMKVKKVREML